MVRRRGSKDRSVASKLWNLNSCSLTFVLRRKERGDRNGQLDDIHGNMFTSRQETSKQNINEQCKRNYLLVLAEILLNNSIAILKSLPHARVHDQFFSNTVAGKFPDKLVGPAGFFVLVLGIEDLVVVLFEFSVVLLDRFRDAVGGVGGSGSSVRHGGGWGGGEKVAVVVVG